jgi:hypothetical protein
MKLKRTTYLIYCIVCLACLSTACTAQAIEYYDCYIIASGRSLELTTYPGTWNAFRHPVHIGYLPYVEFGGCEHTSIIVIAMPPMIRICSNLSTIRLDVATGIFVWNMPLSHYMAVKTFICAKAMIANIEWDWP